MTTDNPVTVIDCMGANLGAFPIPADVKMAGYVTGTDGVPWTPAQFSRYPDAVRIDQAPLNDPADETADVYDLEPAAGTTIGVADWVRAAWANYRDGIRPGQRAPAVYCGMNATTSVVNALLSAGISSGVNLWVAAQMPELNAQHLLASSNGPFPIIGVQYQFNPNYDVSLVSAAWLTTVSRVPAPPKPQPGTQTGWCFCHKCQGLFYGPGIAESACPRGGGHDNSNSHSYTLGFEW